MLLWYSLTFNVSPVKHSHAFLLQGPLWRISGRERPACQVQYSTIVHLVNLLQPDSGV